MTVARFRVRTQSIFLTVAMLAALLFAPPPAIAADPVPGADFTLTLLHNNDGESQLVDAGSGLEDFGGVARFKTLVDGLRADATANGNGVLMLSSGDNFLAGPEFNASLENGIPFYDALAIEAIGYDAISLGNHDFDFGPDILAQFLSSYSSAPPYLSANLDFSGEPALQAFVDSGVISASTVVTTAGEDVGIVGAITTGLRSISSPRNVVIDFNLAAAIQAEIDALTASGVNKIVLISHLQGIDEDIALLAELSGVDVAIAGGGDELLANPGDPLVPGEEGDVFGAYPLTATDADGNDVPVVTTPGEYKYVGQLSVGFDADGNVIGVGADSGPKVVDGTLVPDPTLQTTVVDPVVAAIEALDATVLGTSEVALDGTRTAVRSVETNEGNLIADALRWQAGELAADFGVPVPDVGIQNGGGIRNNTVIEAGDITVLDTFDMVPFGNFVSVVPDIPRAQFKEILENAYSNVPGDGRFAQISGFSVVYDPTATAMDIDDATGDVITPGERILSVTLDDGTAIVQDGAVVPGDPVNVATIDFLARGGDEYPYRGAAFTSVGVSYQQAVANYIVDGLGGVISAADYPVGGEGRIDTPPADFGLVIHHNNDGESQLINAGSGLEDFGGVARFGNLLSDRRALAASEGFAEILLSSGDNFLAGPEFNASLEKGVPFYDTIALDQLGYDAIAIGNHDFDFGPDILADFIEGFSDTMPPYVSANLDFSGEPRLQALVDSGRIVASTVVTKDGRRIGIVGATTPRLDFISSPRGVDVLDDVAGLVQAEVDALTADGVDIVILISHLQGIDEDLELIPLLSNVDVAIAGGGDELLSNPGDPVVPGEEGDVFGPYPLEATDADGVTVPVVTTPGEYKYLGELWIGFDPSGATTLWGGQALVVTGDEDAAIFDAAVQPVIDAVAALDAEVIATSEVDLDGTRTSVRSVETNEGNLIADALRWQANQLADSFGAPQADVGLQNGGGIRNNTVIAAGDITVLDTFDMVPFSNFVSIVPGISRSQFKEILENAYSNVPGDGRFAQVSGFTVVYDPMQTAQELNDDGTVAVPGERILSVTLDDGTEIVTGGAVVDGDDLVVATIDFLARGGDQYPYRGAAFTSVGVSYQQAVENYIVDALGGVISAADYPEGGEGRIVAAMDTTPIDGPFTPIYDIQGAEDASPLDGQPVEVTGVVTGVFPGLGGFYLQDPTGDGDDRTSDGIFVEAENGVAAGDMVDVRGTVTESFDETRITEVIAIEVEGSGSALDATPVTLPLGEGASLERYEGMLITFPDALSVTDTFNLHRFGETLLASGGVLVNPTDIAEPGDAANAVADENSARSIVLDDGSGAQFPDEIPYTVDGVRRRGDTATGITGNLSFSFGAFKIQPTEEVTFVEQNPRPASPDDVGGNITVASFNVLNFFSTIDDGDNGARGADSEAEKAAQLTKLVAAIEGMDADIIGLQEIENNGPVAIGELLDALNASAGDGTWAAAADPDYPGGLETTNAIKVGIIFKPASVTPVGTTEVSEDPVFAEDRPPIAHSFTANGDTFTVIVNHFKSKSPSNAEGPDLDQGDGQGAYNARRTAQAAALIDFTLERVFATADGDVLVIGDFNSYAMEDPIATLEGAGFLANLVKDYLTPEDSYSLVFFGQQGLLDGAFATVTLEPKVTGVDIWHINADETRVLQYNDDVVDPAERSSDFNQPVSQPDQYSSSDHDPIVIGLQLGGTMQVASGLANPRHMNFGADGTLYVAEAGVGGAEPCLTGGDGSEECYGPTGAVTAITDSGQTQIASGLPSVAADGFAATGPQDVAVAADGTVRALIGLGQDPAVRDEILTPAGGGAFGQLVNIGADGSATPVLDVAAYEGANNPDGGAIDSNPNALLHVDTGYLTVDAGANALLHFDGTALTTVAVFPDRMVPAPPFIPEDMIPMQSVPTSVAIGPDGAYYVGELTGFPFPPGAANVYRVDPATGEVTVHATGFTNIVDLEFGPNGDLFVVQISSSSLLSDELDGAVIRVAADGSTETFLGGLYAPTGIAIDQATGDVYVANCGICPGFGEVLKVAGVAPSPISLGYAATSDRAVQIPLAGATVGGTIYPFVLPLDPGLGFVTVDLYLDGVLNRTEYRAPYDFQGGLDTRATGWDTSAVADGEHTMRAVANLPDGSTIETSATFTVSNAAEAGDFSLAVSSDPFRTGAVALDGAVVHGAIYAFIDPLFPDGYEGFRSVDFFLDGTLLHTEYAAPYDAISGGTEKANEALDTTALADGTHELTVRANRDGGAPLSATATFTVANNLGDIVDVAAADGRFTTLVTAVQAAGLEGTLRGLGPFTVLAPTDDAFAALAPGTVEGLLENPAALADILTYHVLAGSVDSATIAGLTAATTLQGSDVTIEVVDGAVILNGTAEVIITDIPASNGIIHAIDMVLTPPAPPPVRFATFNASLNRSNAGDLIADLSTPDNEQAQAVAEIIQRTRPEVLLINEFDYDDSGEAARLFQENYLSVSQNGAEPIVYDYAFSAPSNTGIASGLDLDNSGDVGGPNDAFGFGFFPGQFGMQVYSQYPIDFPNVRTFQNFLWADMPGALLPFDPVAFAPWYSPEELEAVRLSSKSHWDVPIMIGDDTVNFLVSHPTPPVFDGPEDRNGTRNYDEIRFWKDYVNGADYIYDDAGMTGGWSGDYFVIAGDQNADPFDGDSQPGAAQLLLDDARINTSVTPSSPGAVEQDGLQAGANLDHTGDPAFDTADFNDNPAPGNLRADYVLPSANLDIVDAAVFWPESTDPLFDLVGTFPFPSSDHRLVWVDVRPGSTELPPPPEPEMLMTYTVTVENLTNGQPFTPLGVTVHDPAFDVFEVGEPATAGIQALAENGDLTGIAASIQASRSLQSGGYAGSAPLVPATDPGGTGLGSSDTFTVTALPGHVLSLGFMLICTNDGFSGLDSVAFPAEGETLVIETNAYDAGTEINTEDFADMVPPCQGLIGVTSDDDGTGASNPDLAEGGVIAAHSGIVGGTDLDPAVHGWTDPVARITIVKGDVAPEPSIFEIAAADAQFSTLVTALEQAGLDTVLDEDGPFTVFAPTNDAFDGLPPGLVEELLGDPGFLEATLLFHVLDGSLSSADLGDLTEVVTLLGAPLSIEMMDGLLLIDGVALVIGPDIQASNGVIHVIDFVLIPPPPPEQVAFLVAEWQRGTAEVPAIEGSSSLSLALIDVFEHDPATLEFCFFVNTSIGSPVAAHIHRGVAGENGDVVVNTGFDADSFQVDEFFPTDKFAEGCVDVERALAEEIIATPGNFYFNVHSVEYPGGENREQLFDASMLAGPPIDFTVAPWRGDLVVPGPGDPGANGRITFTIPQTDTGEWCFNSFISQTEQLDGGYIGAGVVGEASTSLVDLQIGSRWPVVQDPNGQQWIVNGCERVPADLQTQITAAPADFHAQVRTAEFPDGAARAIFGLGAGDENVYLAELFPVDPAVEGGGFTPVVLFPMQDYVCWGVEANGIGEPTAVSINDATGPLMNFNLDVAPFLGGPFAEFTSLGCQSAPAGLAADILAAPGSFEVVVSNAAGPALAGPIFDPEAPPIGEVPAPRDPDSIPLPNGFQPEGVAIGNGTDVFAGSLVTGVIYKADTATKEGAPLVIPTDGRSAVGMTVDKRTNYLFVAGGPFGTAFVYDGDTGEEMAFIQLTDAAPFETLINDVIVTEDAAYFTDTFQPVFYEVPLGAGGALPDPIVVNEIPLGGAFPFTPGTINSNGIVAAGDVLVMNHTDEGRLFTVDPATGAAAEIDLGGATLPSGDGLILDGTTLYVVQNALDQIGVVELSADFSTGTLSGTITSPLFRVPTTGDQSNGDIYVVNARFDVAPPPFPGTPPADPGLDYDIVRVSKDSVTPPGPNIVASVTKAPIVPDGDVAGAVTDFVITLDRSLDPAVEGRSLAAGNQIRITLPDAFIDNGFATGAPGTANCTPGPCNLGVLLQGWPQHPIAPPAAKYSLEQDGTHTFVYTALEDLGPAGSAEPGIKQMHLILLGFTNPAAGDYEILVESQTGPGGAWESGTGTLTILADIAPSINVTSVFNDGTPNTIYQTTPAGEPTPLAHDFLLFDATGGPMSGVTLDGNVLMRGGARVGDVTITAPDSATGQSVAVASPSAEIVGPVLGAATARLTAVFTAGSVPGMYTVTYSLDGGNAVTMFVTATEPVVAADMEADLDGASEVPGPGDPDGTGSALVSIEGTTVTWQFTVSAIDMPAAAHIHIGAAGESGGVVVDLLTTGTLTDNGDGTFTAMGTVEADAAVAAAIVANPDGYYVNVHNAAFGAGAVRGQLVLVTG